MRETPRRHWFRYGLRTVLLTVAVVALILGYFFSQFARERRAVKSILARGGTVVYHDPAYGRLQSDRTWKEWFKELMGDCWPGEVFLSGKAVTDEVVRDEVLPLRSMAVVHLTDVSVTNDGLAQLRRLQLLANVKCLRDSRNRHVLDALDEQTNVDMRLTPLQDAMDYFTDLHGITIRLAKDALQQRTAPVTGKLKNQSLSVALDQLLAPLELGSVVDKGTLVITARKTADDDARELEAVRASLPQVKTLVIDPVPKQATP